MILAPFQDPKLQRIVRRAALPEEDVFHSLDDVREALERGFPRLLVCQAVDKASLRMELGRGLEHVPVLTLARPTLLEWESAWQTQGLAVTRIDDAALRLRGLFRRTARTSSWVEGLFADLTLLLGRGLPAELRGFGRRVMEFPFRYPSLASLEGVTGLTDGALKARFRRRGLPSPARYLRWFRLLAAARCLASSEDTTLVVSHRLGFSSDGNFCRWVHSASGITPSGLRHRSGRMVLTARMVEECFPGGAVEGWSSLEGLFLRKVA